MRNVTKLGAVAAAVLFVAAIALPVLAASVSVGDFVKGIAGHKNLNNTDAQLALDALRANGVRLPADLNLRKQLTEGDVAAISRQVGLRVTTSQPDAAFTAEKMDRFFNSFAGELIESHQDDDCAPGDDCTNPGNGAGPPFDPFTRTRGKPKGKAKFRRTPTEPE